MWREVTPEVKRKLRICIYRGKLNVYTREKDGKGKGSVGRSVGRKAYVAKLNVVERTMRGKKERCFEFT